MRIWLCKREALCGCCDLVHRQHSAASVVLLWLSAGFRTLSFIIRDIFDALVISFIPVRGAGKLQPLFWALCVLEYSNLMDANDCFYFMSGCMFMNCKILPVFFFFIFRSADLDGSAQCFTVLPSDILESLIINLLTASLQQYLYPLICIFHQIVVTHLLSKALLEGGDRWGENRLEARRKSMHCRKKSSPRGFPLSSRGGLFLRLSSMWRDNKSTDTLSKLAARYRNVTQRKPCRDKMFQIKGNIELIQNQCKYLILFYDGIFSVLHLTNVCWRLSALLSLCNQIFITWSAFYNKHAAKFPLLHCRWKPSMASYEKYVA